jgi:uncharacterized protein
MRSDQRFVFDTNTLISAACFDHSFGRRAYEYVRDHATFLTCKEANAELRDVADRVKFNRFIGSAARLEFVGPRRAARLPRPTDDNFLELAVVGRAQFIVSRDKDLLVLDPFQGVQILDAERLVALLPA